MRLDTLILGTVRITVFEQDIKKAASLLLAAGLTASFDSDGGFDIPHISLKKYKAALLGVDFEVGAMRGIAGFLYKNRKRYGAFSAFVCLLLYFLFVSDIVWDIRIEGNEDIPASVVTEELSDIGMSIGSRWHKLSQSEVERSLLETSSNIGWVNINRKGNVAYIKVKAKSTADSTGDNNTVYSNIVAAYDCVIEEISVKRGIACVKAGESVKQGQLLISGIIPAELGGGFVRAEGEIFGRVSENVSVFVPKNETQLSYGEERLSEAKIKIFDFSVNIFKSYGKKDNDCVIIEDRKEFVLFGKRLPISIVRKYECETESISVARDDGELVKTALQRLASLRVLRFSDAELLRMSTYGEFTDGGYAMRSSVVVLRNIAKEHRFDKGGN